MGNEESKHKKKHFWNKIEWKWNDKNARQKKPWIQRERERKKVSNQAKMKLEKNETKRNEKKFMMIN